MAKRIQISGMEAYWLRIPQASFRGPYAINLDSAWVDRRCLNRYLRRFHDYFWRR